jgi:hypothetical protein
MNVSSIIIKVVVAALIVAAALVATGTRLSSNEVRLSFFMFFLAFAFAAEHVAELTSYSSLWTWA